MQNSKNIETIKPDTAPSHILAARERTWEAVRRISAAIKPGMRQDETFDIGKKILANMSALKHWHRPNIHIGANTVKFYGDKTVDPEIRLGENDIFYVDIGPVWGEFGMEIEGDAGDSFVTGNDPEMLACSRDARRVFEQVKNKWTDDKIGGPDLYRYATKIAEDMGWRLNVSANGHRIADFPHALYFKGGLTDIDFDPAPYLWVLEIHIRHPERPFGAFYEDVLYY